MAELAGSRVLLRHWREADREPFAAMNANPEVMRYFPAPLTTAASDELAHKAADHIERTGWGLWALEHLDSGRFMGFTGLLAVSDDLPCAPALEIGWRLDRRFWGQGLATEAARVALGYGFTELGLERVVSLTAVINTPSIAVMRRLGLQDTCANFSHPRVASDSPLCEHVLYQLSAADYRPPALSGASGAEP